MMPTLSQGLAVSLLAAALVRPALACKAPEELPLHIQIEHRDGYSAYFVVKIVEVTRGGISGRVVKSFDGSSQAGSAFTMRFIPNEDAHAVCRVPMSAGETRLVLARAVGDHLELSRYDWFNNVASTHERFPQYIADLERSW